METPTPAAPVETPATIPIGQAPSLRAFEEARSKGLTEIPNPAAKPAEETPDPDVEADPDLRKAVDEIEAPKPEETPAEKAARTRRHKEAAIKRRITNLAKARDEHKTARDSAEAELAEWRTGRRTAPPSGTPSAATPTQPVKAGEPASGKPKPTLKDFPLANYKDEDDPYAAQGAALAEAVADWKVDQREAAAAQSRQREQADRDAHAALKSHETREADARTRMPDYDAVVSAAQFPRTPATPALLDLVFRSDLSADMVYHLAKHGDVTTKLLQSPNREALILAFADVQAEVKAALKAKKDTPPASPKVTSAAEPVQPVTAAAGTGVVTPDPKTMSLRQWEEHRKNGGRG